MLLRQPMKEILAEPTVMARALAEVAVSSQVYVIIMINSNTITRVISKIQAVSAFFSLKFALSYDWELTSPSPFFVVTAVVLEYREKECVVPWNINRRIQRLMHFQVTNHIVVANDSTCSSSTDCTFWWCSRFLCDHSKLPFVFLQIRATVFKMW